MRVAWRAAGLLVLPTIALGVVLVASPGRAALALHVWLLVVLALALLALVRAVQDAYPGGQSLFAASLGRDGHTAERPDSLVRLERELTIASSSASDVHKRLRPAITELAAGLLTARRGIGLDRDPAPARSVIGEDVWELVRPDRPTPGDEGGKGLEEADVERIVAALERI